MAETFGEIIAYVWMGFILLFMLGAIVVPVVALAFHLRNSGSKGRVVRINKARARKTIKSKAIRTTKSKAIWTSKEYRTNRGKVNIDMSVTDKCRSQAYRINPYYKMIDNRKIKRLIIELTRSYEKLIMVANKEHSDANDILDFVTQTSDKCERVLKMVAAQSLGINSGGGVQQSNSESEKWAIEALNMVDSAIDTKTSNIFRQNANSIVEEVEVLEKSLRDKGLLDS